MELEFHKCTEEDYAMFSPPEPGSVGPLNAIKSDPKRGMWCIDWSKIALFGNERNLNAARVEFHVLPCNHRLTHLGGKDDRIHPECVANL